MAKRTIVRTLAIIHILFVSIFAFDVFSEGYSRAELLLALFMHLIPAIILVITLAIAWKREQLGGILYLILGIITVFFFKTYQDIVTFILISFPIFTTGVAFLYLQAPSKN